MQESIFNTEGILEISGDLVADLKRRAEECPRKRFRYCMHHSVDDLTQEMLIVFAKGTFMPPHRHLDGKSESYHIIEGTMNVYFFDDVGKVTRVISMDSYQTGNPFLYRLSSVEWHMPHMTSDTLVYHETRTGPFERSVDVEFPEWAPDEFDQEGVKAFLKTLPEA